jgi:hypothetical protein
MQYDEVINLIGVSYAQLLQLGHFVESRPGRRIMTKCKFTTDERMSDDTFLLQQDI